MYEYRAQVVRVIDGDSIVLSVDVGFNVSLRDSFRLLGINAPEKRGPSRAAGLVSTKALEDKLAPHEWIEVRTHKDSRGKYGRWLAELWLLDGTNINKWLVDEGYAVEATY